MTDSAPDVALAFSTVLKRIPKETMDKQRSSRALLVTDPMEKLIPAKLLEEGLGRLLDELVPTHNPVVLFMDRAGGGDGARAASGLMPMLAKRWSGVSMVHVSFATQSRGLGVLIRGILMRSGAMNKVAVHVAAHNRPAEGLQLTNREAGELLEKCNLVITYCPAGTAGLMDAGQEHRDDPLLRRSHLSILSYPDADGLVAGLGEFNAIVESDLPIKGVRFRVQINNTGPEYEDLGSATLGKDHDVASRLGNLLSEAESHAYRVVLEPLSSIAKPSDSLLCPCETTIKQHISSTSTIHRVVPIGSRLVAVAKGKDTLL